jgi:hypothetical protein
MIVPSVWETVRFLPCLFHFLIHGETKNHAVDQEIQGQDGVESQKDDHHHAQ